MGLKPRLGEVAIAIPKNPYVAIVTKGVKITEDLKYLPMEGQKVRVSPYYLRRYKAGEITFKSVSVTKNVAKEKAND